MALNSLIKKIPLNSSCDLSSYQTDVNDYEGFYESNSLFLNKRISNWWKRKSSSSEISGELSYETEGNYFKILKNKQLLGKVSRDYLKLESVDSEAYKKESLQKIYNPYYDKDNYIVTELDYYLFGTLYRRFNIKELKDSFVWHFTAEQKEGVIDDCYCITFKKPGDELYTFAFLINNKVYIMATTHCKYVIMNYIKSDLPEIIKTDSRSNPYYYCQEVKAGFYISFLEKDFDFFNASNKYDYPKYISTYKVEIKGDKAYLSDKDYGEPDYESPAYKQNCFFVLDQKSILRFYTFVNRTPSGEPTSTELRFIINNDVNHIYHSTENHKMWILEGNKSYNYTSFQSPTVNRLIPDSLVEYYYYTIAEEEPRFYSLKTIHPTNYSKKFGKWAINFVNNVPSDIAYEYKKLFYLNGNQNEGGECTDIDGYNDNYIYFHNGSEYYRISIAKADDANDIIFVLDDYYLITTSVSFHNAYCLFANKWFCSCDDWNNRMQWKVKTYSDFWYLENSRYNNRFQVLQPSEYGFTASAQYGSITERYAIKNAQVTAYQNGDIWDGEAIVYDVNINEVDTSTWSKGHSLYGYYYISAYETDAQNMEIFWIDDDYTAPYFEDENGNMKKQEYAVYLGNLTTSSQSQVLYKYGTCDKDGWHALASPDTSDMYTDPTDVYQDNPPLLDTSYIVYTQSILAVTSKNVFKLLTHNGNEYTDLMYTTQEEQTLQTGDVEFVINGSLYRYVPLTNRILDSNNQWVCDTHLFLYIGFSSKMAYFYSLFDKGLYVFTGDNTMNRIWTIERKEIIQGVQDGTTGMITGADALNIPSIDFVLFNLKDSVGILYGEQFAILETGKINSWAINKQYGTFRVNGKLYSLIKENLSKGNTEKFEVENIPVHLETLFYGSPTEEKNTINDCVYITVDNLNGVKKGSVNLQAKVLQNTKVIEGKIKTYNLKESDFTNQGICLIKFQPDIQEGLGFKLIVDSDFEVSDIRIGTSQGAMNQTKYRI